MASGRGVDRDSITRNLSVIYEDVDVVVYTAPNEDELKEIILNLLKEYEKMTIRDIHSHLSGLASEDKIRYALNDLMKDNMVYVDRNGYFYLSSLEYEYDGAEMGYEDYDDFYDDQF
ncbi:MAG: hypothetical protein GSR84_01290 [Desulfurococcales archaeon]|nr:hypothetical protein [Desulfurococcales archaeon]